VRPIQRLLSLLRENETAQSIAIAISVTVTVIGLVILLLEWPPSEFRAVTSTNYSTIDYEKVTCVSIGPHDLRVGGKDIPDPKLAKFIAEALSIKSVLFDATYSQCPWLFFVEAVPGSISAAGGGILPAQYLMAVGICQRIDDGHVDLNRCLKKNVYVFNWRVTPHDLFRVAVVGLKPETMDHEPFTVKVADD
jgi:hypothetical protein